MSQNQQCTRIGEKKGDTPAIIVVLVMCWMSHPLWPLVGAFCCYTAVRSSVLASCWTWQASVVCCHWSVGHHRSSSVICRHIVHPTVDHRRVVHPTIGHHRIIRPTIGHRHIDRLTVGHCHIVHPTIGHCHIIHLTVGQAIIASSV